MENLVAKYLNFNSQRGSNVCKIIGHAGSNYCDSKSCQRGYIFLNFTPKVVYIWDIHQLDGRINWFRDIKQYIEGVKSWQKPDGKLFCQVNYFGARLWLNYVLKKRNLDHGSYVNYIVVSCQKLGITGLREGDNMTRHGLRATVNSQLLQKAHDVVSVAMRSGHRQVDSANEWPNIRGSLGKQQQQNLLPNVSSKKQKDPTSAHIESDASVKLLSEAVHSITTSAEDNHGIQGKPFKFKSEVVQAVLKNISTQNPSQVHIAINFKFNYYKTNGAWWPSGDKFHLDKFDILVISFFAETYIRTT